MTSTVLDTYVSVHLCNKINSLSVDEAFLRTALMRNSTELTPEPTI